jgi:glycosyltransferase involved in cell wall biosynthesis
MKLGVIIDLKANFVSDLLADWQYHYTTSIFSFKEIALPISKGRINRWRLRRALRDFIDSNEVLFFEWAGPLLVTASHLRPRKPILARLHSYEIFEFAPLIDWRAVEKIIFVSHAMRRRFETLYPEHASRTEVVYQGKPLDQFRPEPREFGHDLGMLCDITPIKRVYELILAVYELRQRGYCFRLHIGGEPRRGGIDDRYYASIESAIDKLELREQVRLYGHVENPASWLRNIDVYVSNSFWEGQQTALIEAMATGCYCLSHFWDGAEEVLPKEYLYASDGELQEQLIRYSQLTGEEKRRHHQGMRRLAEDKFDLKTAAAKSRQILEEVYRKDPSRASRASS